MIKHAVINRNVLRGIVAALALGGVQVATAAYVNATPPSGFAVGPNQTFTFASKSPMLNKIFGKVIYQTAGPTIHVSGKAITMPAAYRLTPAAARMAAAAIFANPYVRTGAAIAAWLGVAKVVWDESEKIWRQEGDKNTGEIWKYEGKNRQLYSSPDAACSSLLSDGYLFGGIIAVNPPSTYQCQLNGQYQPPHPNAGQTYPATKIYIYGVKQIGTDQCPTGWTSTPAGCLSPALDQPKFEELLAPANNPGSLMPERVPLELPDNAPLETERPFINPDEGEDPQSRPLFVPTGDPVPNPQYDPQAAPSPQNQPFLQPGVRIVPSPTPTEPWRVDIQPVNRPVETNQPLPGPQPEIDPDAPKGDKPKEDTSDLCEKNPDILACQKPELDTPEEEIPKSDKELTFQIENPFGGGACPADVVGTVAGRTMLLYDWGATCGVIATWLRPLILVLGALGALFILIPGRDS